jgi:hypothetical protein
MPPLVHIADAILILIAAEAAFLLWRSRRGGPPAMRFLPNLISGACLIGALRVALGDGPHVWLLALLGASFAAHLTDLRGMHK